jgi:hypothetical protein
MKIRRFSRWYKAKPGEATANPTVHSCNPPHAHAATWNSVLYIQYSCLWYNGCTWYDHSHHSSTGSFRVTVKCSAHRSSTLPLRCGPKMAVLSLVASSPLRSGFGGLVVSMLASGSNPAEAVGFFPGVKNPEHAFLRKGSIFTAR